MPQDQLLVELLGRCFGATLALDVGPKEGVDLRRFSLSPFCLYILY